MKQPIQPVNNLSRNPSINAAGNMRPLAILNIISFYLLLLTSSLLSSGARAQTALFTADDTAGCKNMIVRFTNTSTGASSYSWDLGNGNTSTLKDPAGTYTAVGTYTVTLTAFSGSGSSTYSMLIRVYGDPVVNFASANRTVCPGDPVVFTNTSVANCWGALSYKWNFGEGGSGTVATPTYNYVSPGSFNVTLLATNNAGCVSSLSKSAYIFVYTPAVVGFNTATPFICHAPGPVSFTNSSTGTAPLSYTWVFGDGSTAGGTTATHTYMLPGTAYDVTLRVTDGHGCTDSMVRTALVTTGSLKANFSAPTDTCLRTPVTFNNTSSTHTSSMWYFGDGGTSTADTSSHTYAATGIYPVKLVISDGTCKDSITKNISLNTPSGSFTITPAGICGDRLVAPSQTFTASVPAGSTVSWSSYKAGPMGAGTPLSYTYPGPFSPSPTGGLIDGISMFIKDKFGCKDTIKYVRDTINKLEVFAIGAPGKGCIPLAVNFSAIVESHVISPFLAPNEEIHYPYPYAVSSYSWDFGDGSALVSGPAPVHTYTAAGKFHVKCTVNTVNGCTTVGENDILAGSPPKQQPSFTMDRTHVCAGEPILFTNTTFGLGLDTQFFWNFDAGAPVNTDTIRSFYRVMTHAGMNVIKLTSIYNGCFSLLSYSINDTVDAPEATITHRYSCIPANGMVFNDSLNQDDSRLWQFSDGTTSTAQNPVHLFPALTDYTVKLTTHNSVTGCTNSSSMQVTLRRVKSTLTPRHASICQDAADSVVANISNVMIGDISVARAVKSLWYINRSFIGTSIPIPDRQFPDALASDTFYNAYNRWGLDTATLITTDNRGCLDTSFTKIIAARPKVNFSFSPTSGCGPLPVTLKDMSTDMVPLSGYSWSFGDGASASVGTTSVVHNYSVTAPGGYSVREIVTDNLGCIDSFTNTVNLTITAAAAKCKANPSGSCVGLNVNFSNSGSSPPGSYLWIFGDGATSTIGSPSHVYTAAGTYNITFVAVNAAGCRDTGHINGYKVDIIPKASFTMNDSFAVCPPLVVNFTNTSTGATGYQWSFGDGTNSAGTSPSDIYTAIGLYKVKLQAVNQFGCTDTAVHYASIFGYAGAFTYAPKNICTSTPVHFKATLSGVTNISWDFSDGVISGSSLLDTISHKYPTAGYYIPKLILTDSSGCTSVSTGIDTIKVDTLRAGFKVIPDSSCKDNSVTFTDTSFSLSSPITSWLWKFGNGATSTANNPAYTYSLSGTYTASLTVTNGTGCTGIATKSIKVNPSPTSILGKAIVCVGQQTTLSDGTSGGKWSSNNTSVATIDAITGVMNGVGTGSAGISYTLPTGCYAVITATVNPLPAPITISGGGPFRLCEGFTNTFLNTTAGGAWSIANTSIARLVTMGTGVVAGLAAGITPIYYTLTSGCAATVTVTVDQSPGVISGASGVCIGSVIVLTNTITGGAWTSSNSSLASIGSSSGIVTGIASGLVVIDYSLPTGCTQTKTVNVNPPLPPITSVTGSMNVCVGTSITLTDASVGGTWASSNTAIATITFGSGKVTGVAPGTTTISYTSTDGCIGTTTVTVNTSPPAIDGNRQVCLGATTTLSDADPVGTWSTASTTIISVGAGTGVVTGLKSSTGTITYTVTTGCATTAVITVNPLPVVGLISRTVCVGVDTTVFSSFSGGTWSTSNTSVMSIAPGSGLGIGRVTGMSVGTATITYTHNTGCYNTNSMTVISLKPPTVSPGGVPELCSGAILSLTDTGGGTWSSGNTLVALVGTSSGVVTAQSAGTAVITYLISTSRCRVDIVVSVNPTPPAISGMATMCVNDIRTFSNAMSGGAWSSSLPSIATVGSASGVVTGMSAGTATITYMMPTGCYTTADVVINPLPGSISGNTSLCAEHKTTLSDGPAGGIWSTANTTIVFVEPVTGVVTGNNAGTATITYTLGTGCKATVVVTVHPSPAAIVATNTHICLGDTALLADATAGGIWISSDPGIAVVPPDTGIVSGVVAGVVTISYQLATTCVSTMSFTVNAMPSAINGPAFLCYGGTSVFGNVVPGGTWSSSDASVASVNDTGLASGISVGTAGITYTTTGNCTAMTTVTVYPTLYPINGDTMLCIGSVDTLYESTPGGLWSSSNTAVASIDASGAITGKTAGRTHIAYTLANSCGTAEADIEVFPLPYAGAIKGDTSVCTHGTIQLTDSIKGGIWMSRNDKLATVDTFGVVTGIAPGLDTIYYMYSNRCGTDIAQLVIAVSQAAENAHIIIHPDSLLCSNTLFMNFGADSPEPKGGHYVWSAANAIVYAVSKNKQNCLISFPNTGVSTIKLSSQVQSSDCMSEEKLTFNISSEFSPYPEVIYYDPEFVCKDHMVDSFKWGYDDVVTLDSTLIPGAVNQNYYEPSPDFSQKNYWVLTYRKGCMQKSYYNVPTLVKGAGVDGVDIKLYPNPADATVNIMVSGINRADIIGYRLVDILGKERVAGNLTDGKGSIQLSGAVPGVYMVLFTRNGINMGAKVFVKN